MRTKRKHPAERDWWRVGGKPASAVGAESPKYLISQLGTGGRVV